MATHPEANTYRISHDGVHWAGSFQLALGAMLTDLLADGPLAMTFEALIEPAGPAGEDTELIAGTVAGIDAAKITFTDRDPLPRHRVLSAAA